MRGAAAIYVRRGRVFIVTYSQTVDGFWIEDEPWFQRDEFDPDAAAALLWEALDGTRLGVPTPPRDSLGSMLPELAGVKTYGAFMKGTASVDVSLCEAGSLAVTPMRNGGASAGFEPMVESAIELESEEQLADALVAALEIAE